MSMCDDSYDKDMDARTGVEGNANVTMLLQGMTMYDSEKNNDK